MDLQQLEAKLDTLKTQLVANGVRKVRTMTPTTMVNTAYTNDLISSSLYDTLTTAIARYSDTPNTQPKTTEETTATKEQPTMTTAPAPAPAPVQTTSQAEAIAALLATLQPQAPQLDEQRIIELINNHSPKPRELTVNIQQDGLQVSSADVGVVHRCFDDCLEYLKAGLNLFLYGRSGSGKSTTAEKLAKALDTQFYSMGSILTKFELLGSFTKEQYNPSVVRQWLENPEGGILNIDEIDGSCPRALVNTMPIFDKNGGLTFLDGKTFKRTDKHLITVSANTTGAGANAAYVGRARLDAATLNRFVRIEHDYDVNIEKSLASKNIVAIAHKVREIATQKGFEGTLVTPRTIAQAGQLERQISDKNKLSKLLKPLFKQGLTANEWGTINNSIANMPL